MTNHHVLCLLLMFQVSGCHLIFPFTANSVEPNVDSSVDGPGPLGDGAVDAPPSGKEFGPDLPAIDQALADVVLPLDGMTPLPGCSLSLGGIKDDKATAVAVDQSGSIYITGQVQDSAFLNTTPLSTSSAGCFVAKINPGSCSVDWIRQIDGSGVDGCEALAVDSVNKRLYVVGTFYGTATVSGPGGKQLVATGGSNYDILLAAFSLTGTPVWANNIGSASNDYGRGVAVDNNGNITVVGHIGASGQSDVYVASFDSAGVARWSKSFGSSSAAQFAWATAADASDNVYVAGSYAGTVDFGKGVHTSSSGFDLFVASFDTNGVVRWSNSAGSASADRAVGLAVHKDRVYVTGWIGGTATFDKTTAVPSNGSSDLFVARYAATTGAFTWARSFGSNMIDLGQAVAVDAVGNVLVSGELGGTLIGPTAPPTHVGMRDVMVLSLTPDGATRWIRSYGNTGDDHGYGVAVAGSGLFYVCGDFSGGNVAFGSTKLKPYGKGDGFLFQLK